jgi:hypothetical protein
MIRNHARREDELVDRIMYQAGQTWTRPPRSPLEEDDEPDVDIKEAMEGWVRV